MNIAGGKIGDIYNYHGTIQSRSASIDRFIRIYRKDEEEKIYLAVIELLCKRYPNIIKPEDIEYLKSEGRLFLVDYIRNHQGEHYTLTHDVSTKWNIENGKIDKTMFHELIHKLTFLKGIITQDDFQENAPYYEGATELVTQNAFGIQEASRLIKKGDVSYTVNLSGDVVYSEQVALLRQIDLLLGGDFVEQCILQDKKALENEMAKQFGEHTYTMFFEKMADTMNNRSDSKSISDAIDMLQTLILENCCTIKFFGLRTEQESLEFMAMLQQLGQMRLTTPKNLQEFKEKYNGFYKLAQIRFKNKGYDLSKLKQYENFEYIEYPRQDNSREDDQKKKEEIYNRRKIDLMFENSQCLSNISFISEDNRHLLHLSDKILSKETFQIENVSDIDIYTYDLEGDHGLIATFMKGELIGLTRRVNAGRTKTIATVYETSWRTYIGQASINDAKAFESQQPQAVFKVAKEGLEMFDEPEYKIEDYFLQKEDGMIAVLNTDGKASVVKLQKANDEQKLEILDGIRSEVEIRQYFREQKDKLGKELGVTFYR